jgi:hypothetical protein
LIGTTDDGLRVLPIPPAPRVRAVLPRPSCGPDVPLYAMSVLRAAGKPSATVLLQMAAAR